MTTLLLLFLCWELIHRCFNRMIIALEINRVRHFLITLPLMFLVGTMAGQMTGGGRVAQPKRPLPPGIKTPIVNFVDIARQAGLTGVNVSGSEQQQDYIVENIGNGIAVFDYDNDGLPDIFIVNGDRFPQGKSNSRNYLYHNLGGLRFEDVTEQSGLAHISGWGQGVCAGDFDNDGFVDLFITSWGHNALFRNQGNGTFLDVTKSQGLDSNEARWSTGCAFLDYDRDGRLDLFVAHYLKFDPLNTPRPDMPNHCVWSDFPVPCGPVGLPPESMSLYHNEGTAGFRDVSISSGIAKAHAAGLTVLTGDFDDDGWPDVYVAADATPSLLFLNRRDGTFVEVGARAGVAYNEDGREQSGMGAIAGDLDGSGLLDILKTNFVGDIPNLYRNLGKAQFSDVSSEAGLGVNTGFVGWGCALLDVDNDGRKDILIVNGHVYPDIDGKGIGQTFRQHRLLYWNRGDGQFFDISNSSGPGILAQHSSRGLAVGDFDNDGSQELVVVNMHEGPSLLKNTERGGHSMLVRALTPSGRDAIGAQLILSAGGKRQLDEVRSGGSFISQSDFRIHFGLGKETSADLTVRWPDGAKDHYRGLSADQWFTIQQGRGIVRKQVLAKRFEPKEAPSRPNVYTSKPLK